MSYLNDPRIWKTFHIIIIIIIIYLERNYRCLSPFCKKNTVVVIFCSCCLFNNPPFFSPLTIILWPMTMKNERFFVVHIFPPMYMCACACVYVCMYNDWLSFDHFSMNNDRIYVFIPNDGVPMRWFTKITIFDYFPY